MRSWTTALLTVALVGCGISQQAEQKALDTQKQEMMSSTAKSESALKSQLAKAQADVKASQQALAAAKADCRAADADATSKLAALQTKLDFALAAEKARAAESLAFQRKYAEAGKLAVEVADFAKAKSVTAATKALDEATPLLKKKLTAKAAPKLAEAADVLEAAAR